MSDSQTADSVQPETNKYSHGVNILHPDRLKVPVGLSQLILDSASTSQPPPEIQAHTGPSSSPTLWGFSKAKTPELLPPKVLAAACALRAASAPSRSTLLQGRSCAAESGVGSIGAREGSAASSCGTSVMDG